MSRVQHGNLKNLMKMTDETSYIRQINTTQSQLPINLIKLAEVADKDPVYQMLKHQVKVGFPLF